ncbi:NAD-dependent epimerase/dehydratase family protein [Sphingobacterium siyangense]|uniref:NAD-dependent epimerase/dehydratase family protein n=1 Tax=Sphingobacterium siyangense TaxID=459529 RepID=UPI0025DCB3CA|nr:NAD-dependent epimerase/dehydratase family protein [uncultured Sphingobacterium sp.]
MNIALIGGSGFVGTKLISLLQQSSELNLINIDKNPSASHASLSVIADVMDLSALKEHLREVDVVILLAAEHRDDVTPASRYYDVNVQGMRNTLEAMEENNVKRIIFTSSVAVYGLDKNNPDETFPADPFNHYGKSKWEAEQVLQRWYQNHRDWNINIVRPTVIFGEGNRGNVFNLLNQIANGRFMMIGDGNNQKSMTYIGNIIAFIRYMIFDQRRGYNVFNYVDKPDFTTNDLVYHTGNILGKSIPTTRIPYWLGMMGGYCFDILAFITRKKLNISAVRVKKFCAVTKYDSKKAMTSGFVPPFTLEEGLGIMLREEFKK